MSVGGFTPYRQLGSFSRRNIILVNIEEMCPMKTFKVAEFKEVWMTNEAIEAIKDKERALNKARTSGIVEDWLQAKLLRNRVGREVENLRADYLKNQQELHKNDPKKFWQTIASIVPGKKGKQGNIWLKNEEGEDIELKDSAVFINTFFTNIGPKLASKQKSAWRYFGEEEPNSIEDIQTNQEEVLKLCKEIEVMKASGMDLLSGRICKDAFTVLSHQLCHLFNCSLRTGVFPDLSGRLPK